MIKLLVFDIDGTICAGNDEMTPLLKKTLKTVQVQYPITYILASGRPYFDILAFLQKNDLDYDYIMMNGAAYVKSDVVYHPRLIPNDIKQNILQILLKHDVPFACYGAQTAYTKDSKNISFFKQMEILYDCSEPLQDIFKEMKQINTIQEVEKEDILKIETITFDEDKKNEIKQDLLSIPNIQVVSSMDANIEISGEYANKGICIKEYNKDHQLQDDEVMVFGDSENDKSMFEMFENSVFVNNHNHIRYKTKYVTQPCDKDGVAHFLLDYFHL